MFVVDGIEVLDLHLWNASNIGGEYLPNRIEDGQETGLVSCLEHFRIRIKN